ncbi:Mago nashi protein, partial [Rhizophagus irregularis]
KKNDQKWSKKNVVKQQELEIRLDNKNILFKTAKIEFLVDIQESNDLKELYVFYYLNKNCKIDFKILG